MVNIAALSNKIVGDKDAGIQTHLFVAEQLANPMKRTLAIISAAVMVSCASRHQVGIQGPLNGHPRFEIFGMLDEYWGRQLADSRIESFYPDERTAADHFEKLLSEFAKDERVPPHWRRHVGSSGHVTFDNLAVAAAINSYYRIDPDLSTSPSTPAGTLDSKIFEGASRADMLRYIAGAYVRRGDGAGLKRSLFCDANACYKFPMLAEILRHLGCRNVILYSNAGSDLIPTGYLLTFSATTEVRSALGIEREISDDERTKWIRDSKLKRISSPPVLFNSN